MRKISALFSNLEDPLAAHNQRLQRARPETHRHPFVGEPLRSNGTSPEIALIFDSYGSNSFRGQARISSANSKYRSIFSNVSSFVSGRKNTTVIR
jgi:hypothetical protein